jgi:peptidoglycan hydrolase CwlO-like protein
VTSDKEKEAEVVIQLRAEMVQLKATIDNLTNAAANCNIIIEEKKDCKCSITNTLNTDLQTKVDDLQKKVDRTRSKLDLRENELKLKVEEIRLLNEELRNSE